MLETEQPEFAASTQRLWSPGAVSRVIAVAISVLLATGCALVVAQAIPVQRLASASSAYVLNSGLTEPARIVVQDATHWAEVWMAVHANRRPVPRVPEIDFADSMVLVVALGQRPTGGFDVVVSAVEVSQGRLVVSVRESHPSPECVVSAALVAPVDLAVIPRLGLPIDFDVDEVTASCS